MAGSNCSRNERSCLSPKDISKDEFVASYGIWKMRLIQASTTRTTITPGFVDFTLGSAHSERGIEIAR